MVLELQACLIRTAEQQYLLRDAVRLLDRDTPVSVCNPISKPLNPFKRPSLLLLLPSSGAQ